MEWAIGIPLLIVVLICPLMMVGAMVIGWLFVRRGGSHGGHRHGMMCMMGMEHGGHGHRSEASDLLEELKAERDRLDALVAKAEKAGKR